MDILANNTNGLTFQIYQYHETTKKKQKPGQADSLRCLESMEANEPEIGDGIASGVESACVVSDYRAGVLLDFSPTVLPCSEQTLTRLSDRAGSVFVF